MNAELGELTERFLDEVIWKESWFIRLDAIQAWDAFVLAGSHVRGDAHKGSDIDLFLVTPHEVQKAHKLSPVHEYDFEGHHFDVSKVTTEKLHASTQDKRNLFWWHNTKLIRANNESSAILHKRASNHTPEEIRCLVWNSYCLFELERMSNLESALKQKDELGVRLCFNNCIRYAAEMTLVSSNIFVTSKKQGSLLLSHHPDVYRILLYATSNFSTETVCTILDFIRMHLVDILLRHNYLPTEISNWHQHNVDRFLHQAI